MGYNLILLQLEVILFFSSFAYILYYLSDKIYAVYRSLRSLFKSKKISQEDIISQVDISDERTGLQSYITQNTQISLSEKEKLGELLKKVQANISRCEYDVAKNLIIEGLTIDKFHIDFNLELAGIYMLQEEYSKAEYIYKDLLLVHQEDFEILKKLAYTLTMQEKYDLAIEIYKQAFDIKNEDMEVINMLSNLYYYKGMYVDSIEFLKIFFKEHPKHVENLILLASCYENLGKILDAVNTYDKVLALDPYNKEALKELEKLKNLEYIPKQDIPQPVVLDEEIK